MNHQQTVCHRARQRYFCVPVLFLVLCFLWPVPFASGADKELFDHGLSLVKEKDFRKIADGIEKIAASGDNRSEAILTALAKGKLYRIKKDGRLVLVKTAGSQAEITSVLTGKPLGTVKKRSLKKIKINNKLRTLLKNVQARTDLHSANPEIRLTAVNKLLESLTPKSSEILKKIQATESNDKVSRAISTALAVAGLRSIDTEEKLQALDTVKKSLNPAVRNEIKMMLTREQDATVQKKAEATLASIESTIAVNGLVEKLFFGLSLGSVLVLAAIGLAITFGVIGVINMAHGELIMLGAYTTYVIQQLLPGSIGLALFLSIPAAFIVSGLSGILIERSVIRFLYGRPLETLLATFGISLVLQQTVRTIFSPLNRSVATPAWMSGSLQINPVLSLTINRLTIFIFALLVFAGLYFLLKKSSIGLQVRAVSQNRAMARAMGIQAAKVDALTFGLGSGIAGIAGVALSQLTNVGPNLGQAYIIDSFMVVVFGGVGNLWGTLIGGLSLGVANKFLEPWAGAVLAKILILVFIILFIQKRPQGLFPQKGRAAG